MIRRIVLISTMALVLGAGCHGPPSTKAEVSQVEYPSRRRAVDLLFVLTVGNSTSMLKQYVGWSFPKLYEALRLEAGDDLSLHVGTISTNLGAGPYEPADCAHQGQLFVPTHDVPKPTASYLDLRGARSNVEGEAGTSLSRAYDAFGHMAFLPYPEGSGRCAFFGRIQPLESSRVALLPGRNPGFLRDDALLVVVYVIDTMDCSLQDHALFDPASIKDPDSPLGPYDRFRCFEFGFRCDQRGRELGPRTNCYSVDGWVHSIPRYIDFFRQLKAPGSVILAAIGGTPGPLEVVEYPSGAGQIKWTESCYEGGALPAVRTHRLLEAFPPLLFASKCNSGASPGDYGPFMARVGEAIGRRLSLRCLPPPADARRAGWAPRCEVVARSSTGAQQIPRCAEAPAADRCWSEVRDVACAQSSARALELRGELEEGSRLQIRCLW